MDGSCLSLYTCKRCIVLKQFDGLNFDGLAAKHQTSKFLPVKILRYTVYSIAKYRVSCAGVLVITTKSVIQLCLTIF